MQITAKTVREHIARAKSYIQREDYVRTLSALCQALSDLGASQIFGRERLEINVLLEEAMRDLSGMKQIKKLFPQGLAYVKGQEKVLHATLKRLRDKLEAAIEKVRVAKLRQEKMALDELLIAAQEFLAKKEPMEARKLFRRASEQYSHEPGLNVDIGNRLMQAGHLPEALDYFMAARDQDPRDPRPWQYAIMCYEGMNESEKAEQVVRDALKKFGGNDFLLLRLAKLCLAQRKWDEAFNSANSVFSQNPLNQDAIKILREVGPRLFGKDYDPVKSGGQGNAGKGTGTQKPARAPGQAIKLDL